MYDPLVTKVGSLTAFGGGNFLLLLTCPLLRSLTLNSLCRIPRGPGQQPLEDRIFAPTVSAVYSTVSDSQLLILCVCFPT